VRDQVQSCRAEGRMSFFPRQRGCCHFAPTTEPGAAHRDDGSFDASWRPLNLSWRTAVRAIPAPGESATLHYHARTDHRIRTDRAPVLAGPLALSGTVLLPGLARYSRPL